MRKLKLLVVVLLGLVLVLPYWVGREAEKVFVGKAAALSRSNDWQVDVQVVSYERGWYRSTAQTRLTVRGAKPDEGLTLNHDIVHGPVPLGDVVHGKLPLSLVRAVVYSHDTPSSKQASSERTPFVTLRTEVGLREDIMIDYGLHPDQDAKQGFEWSAVRGTASFPKIGKPTATFELPGLRAAQGAFSLDIGKVSGQFELDSSTSGIPLGEGTVEAEQVLLEQRRRRGASPRQLDIRNLSWTHKATERIPGKTIDLSTGVRFGTVRGWANRIQQGEWRLVCQGLDSQALRALSSTVRTADAGRQAELASSYRQPLTKIVSRSPRFETQFKLTTTEGVIEGTGDMTTESTLAALQAGASPAYLPSEWLVTIFFSPGVLDPAKLDPIWQANVLTVDGERYRLTARYRRALVDLNGTVHSLKDFGARMMLLASALRL